MSREILLLVDALAREKNVSKEIVFSALESALAQATKKRINDEADVRVAIDRETGDYESFRRWQVLPDEEVENDEAQMGLIDAREEYPEIQVGDYVEEGLEPIDFGRIGAQAAKQVILQKIRDCTEAGKIVDGHAPLLSDKDLNAYIAAGVQSDHECSNIEEAMEKLRRGQYIMIREGTAAKNMEALMPLFREPYCSRCMLVTDDKHPGDLLDSGHIDSNIRKAIRLGADPAVAVKMATLVPAQYFGFKQRGAVAPGYRADLVVVSDLESFTVEQVYKNGTLVAEHGKTLKPAPLDIDRVRFSHVMDSFDLDEITLQDLELRESGEQERVICLNRGELLTEEKIIPFQRHPGKAPGVDPEHNIVKLAVFERHHHSGHVGIGFLGNFSLKCGAVASSIAHDSHNLIVAGDNDTDMMLAGNTVRKNKGGLAFVADGQVVAELALPVAGLMSTESAESVAAKMQALNDALKAHGVAEDIGIFMTLAFVSLPVIPKLRLNTYGIIDVAQQKVVPAVF